MRAAATLVIAFLVAGSMPVSAGGAHEPGTSVEMPYLIAPVVVDGRLVSNAYVSSKIIATSLAATIVVRDRLAFIQDAYVRDVNSVPIGKPGDPQTVDIPALTMRLLADVRRVVGPNLVDSVEIIRIQISPLRGGSGS